MIKRLLIAASLFVISFGVGYYFLTPQELNVGAELPEAPALFETSLAAPITATAVSMTLTSNSVRGGGSLSGYNCFTIDEGSAQAEFVCGTASGTAISNLTRGISPSDGVSEVAALQFSHRRGASVKITDFPIIQLLRAQNNGEATFENILRYAASVVPSSADDLADVGYVLSVVNGGTVNFDALNVAGTAGETLATGTLVYFKSSDQRWWKVDTDDTSTFQNVSIGMTRGPGIAGGLIGTGGVLLKGLQTGLSGLTAGSTYYASSSAGSFNTVTSVLPIGIAKSVTELQFDPVMLSIPRLGFNNTFSGTNTFNATTTFNGMTVGFGNASSTAITSIGTTTYFKSANVKYIIVEVQAAGGNGSSVTGTDRGGGGGGGGGYGRKLILSSSLGSTETITIGAVGSNSSFGTHIVAGFGVNATADSNTAGAGGTSTGGNINISGSTGGQGRDYSSPYGIGGQGGDSQLGRGGPSTLAGNNGTSGSGYGGGGAGGSSAGSSDQTGGTGGPAVVIVTEYY